MATGVDVDERARLCFQRSAERSRRRQQVGVELLDGRDVHDSRKRVVRRLPTIHVVVGVNGFFRAEDTTLKGLESGFGLRRFGRLRPLIRLAPRAIHLLPQGEKEGRRGNPNPL